MGPLLLVLASFSLPGAPPPEVLDDNAPDAAAFDDPADEAHDGSAPQPTVRVELERRFYIGALEPVAYEKGPDGEDRVVDWSTFYERAGRPDLARRWELRRLLRWGSFAASGLASVPYFAFATASLLLMVGRLGGFHPGLSALDVNRLEEVAVPAMLLTGLLALPVAVTASVVLSWVDEHPVNTPTLQELAAGIPSE